MFLFMWLVFLSIITVQSYSGACDETTDINDDIKFLNVSSEFVMNEWNETHPTKYNLSFVYTWKVVIPEGITFDGFLYKQVDRESQNEMVMIPYMQTGSGLLPPPPTPSCDQSGGKKIWTVLNNGSSIECEIPCSDYFPPPCVSNTICDKITVEGYKTLPKNTNRLELNVDFGRQYDMTILVYRHWKILQKYKFDRNQLVRFCREELINHRKFNVDTANKFCNQSQTIADSHFSTGPPSNFENAAIYHDLANNRGKALFRWKVPLDISPHVKMSGFTIFTKGGEQEPSFVKSKQQNKDSYYQMEVTKIKYGVENFIQITPVTYGCDACISYGYSISMDYTIQDINACNESHKYCDEHAHCTDLPSENTTAAVCECHAGFFGDGMKIGGTGCSNLSLKMLTLILPCIALIILITLVFLCIKRINTSRKRSIEKDLSIFVTTCDEKLTNILLKDDSEITKLGGRFGEKYEIDKKHLTLTRIIGRGNFGVVHEANLKSSEDVKTVAVKTTAEPHTKESENDFLFEICLILSIGKHKNILDVIGCCTIGQSNIYLVTSFMKYGDLRSFLCEARDIKKRQQDPIYNISEQNIHYIGQQVASGLEYLTGLRFIHGDIAARNILVDEGLHCKISDFGLANDVYRYGTIQGAREKRIPVKWISPERMQAGKIPITWRSDVWSFGILLYESVTLGAVPYPGVSITDLLGKLESGYRMDKPNSCSQYLYDVMRKCWRWIPSERPSFKEIQSMMKTGIKNDEEKYINTFFQSDDFSEKPTSVTAESDCVST